MATGRALGILLLLAAASASLAQQRAANVDGGASSPLSRPELRTLKERLGAKWMDEQRVDNCRVPLDKRGPKPRPDACPSPPPGSSPREP
jgi:hypothetical protein